MTARTPGIDPTARPSGEGCEACQAAGTWWFHLRRCTECGNIGCCDSSPNQHAFKHFLTTGHPIIRSFEPDESWFWSFETGAEISGEPLAPPQCHPEDQPVPGPTGRVPANWQSLLKDQGISS